VTADEWTEFDAVLARLEWGRSGYTVVALPAALVTQARDDGTHRLDGWVDDVPVNVGIARADVLPDAFFYAGRPLQRRLGLRPGAAVRCRLRPVDPEVVPIADDVAAALATAPAAAAAFDARTASQRRQLLQPVESAATDPTRARRIDALVAALASP
jgi:Bacteriocin-protection, YdeI or OmpD-Associated